MIRDDFKPVELDREELELHINRFIESCSEKSLQTRLTYRRSLNDFIYFFNNQRSFGFLVEDIKKYRKYLRYRKRVSDHTVVTYLSALRQFCSYLTLNGILEKNPALRIKIKRKEKQPPISFLTMKESMKLLSIIDLTTLSGQRDMAIISLMLGCGISERDIVNANVGDVFKPRHKWYFRKLIDKKIFDYPIDKDYWPYFTNYIMKEGEGHGGTPLFVSYSNRSKNMRMTVRGVRENIFRHLQKSGIKRDGLRLTTLTIRNTGAIILAKSGIKNEELKLRLGIKGEDIAERYVKLAEDY